MKKRNKVLQIQAPETEETSDSYPSHNTFILKLYFTLFYQNDAILLLPLFKDLSNFVLSNFAPIPSLLS